MPKELKNKSYSCNKCFKNKYYVVLLSECPILSTQHAVCKDIFTTHYYNLDLFQTKNNAVYKKQSSQCKAITQNLTAAVLSTKLSV